ncbi:MAG: tetratricopeptide repeat protein, partial [Planctomycetota bacterium]
MNSSSSLKSVPSVPSEPNGEGIFQAELSDSARRHARSPLVRGILFLLFAVGVAVPMFLFWLPSERAKWQIAAAQAKWLDGDLAGSIQILDSAAREFPENTAIYAQRIQFYLDAKEFDKALADTERLKARYPKSVTVLGMESEVLHHLGRHDEATAVCREVLRLAEEDWIGSRVHALNTLAYAQAIRNQELRAAADQMSEVLRLHGDDSVR